MKRLLLILLFLSVPATDSTAGNFIVQHNDRQQGLEIAAAAERFRYELAVKWFGQPLPDWPEPVVLRYDPQTPTSGVTTYTMSGGVPTRPRMVVCGPYDKIHTDVLPHEVMHLVLAHRFGRSVPRWLDEGLCSNVESTNTLTRLDRSVVKFLQTGRGIRSDHLMQMKDYPADVHAFYAQSSSLVRFLLWRGGVEQIEAVGQTPNASPAAIATAYKFGSVREMQNQWLDWVQDGSPRIERVLQPSMCDTCPNQGIPVQQMQQGAPMSYGGIQSTPYVPSTPYANQAVPRLPTQTPQTAPVKVTPPPVKSPPSVDVVTGEGPADFTIKVECECGGGGAGGMTATEADTKYATKDNVAEALTSMSEAIKRIEGKAGAKGEPGADGKDAPGMDEIVAAVLARLDTETPEEPPTPPTAGERERHPRVLYFTSRNTPGTAEADAIAERLKAAGLPVTIITLAERDASVQGVPRVFVPDTDKSVIGASNVVTFLSTIFP